MVFRQCGAKPLCYAGADLSSISKLKLSYAGSMASGIKVNWVNLVALVSSITRFWNWLAFRHLLSQRVPEQCAFLKWPVFNRNRLIPWSRLFSWNVYIRSGYLWYSNPKSWSSSLIPESNVKRAYCYETSYSRIIVWFSSPVNWESENS